MRKAAGTDLLAVDVGLTHLCMAGVDSDGRARVLPNAEGHDLTPAAVHFYDAEGAAIGEEARKEALRDPSHVVERVAAWLGEPDKRFAVHPDPSAAWSPQELMALVLRKLREDAHALRGAAPTEVAFAVPGFFDSAQRAALAEAASFAGLQVVSVVPHATAAVFGHGLHQLPAQAAILVVDVRTEGVEATLLQRDGDTLTALATAADPGHGGWRWQERMTARLHEAWTARHGEPPDDLADELRAELHEAALGAVQTLMRKPEVTVQAGFGERRVPVTVARETWLKDTWDLVVLACRPALACLDKLPDGRIQPDVVLLVGEGAPLPGLRRALTHALHCEPKRDDLAHTCVARGLALMMALRAGMKLSTDAGDRSSLSQRPRVASFSMADGGTATTPVVREATTRALGMLVLDQQRHERVVELIPEGTPIPARFRGRFLYAYDNMTSVRVDVTEGRGASRDQVRVIGSVELTGLPPRPRGTPIDVVYVYGDQQILEVEVIDVDTGKWKKAELRFRGATADRAEALQRTGATRVV